MASEAFERLQKKLADISEAQLAELVVRDARRLAENAKEQGVLAYARNPVHRARPNERFLQNTLRSVTQSITNRRVDEAEMWEKRELQLQRELRATNDAGHRAKRSRVEHTGMNSYSGFDRNQQRDGRPGHSSRSSQDSQRPDTTQQPAKATEPGSSILRGLDEQALCDFLLARPVKGKGTVGSRADEPGPYLPASAANMYCAEDADAAAVRAVPLGPQRPAWLVQQQSGSSEQTSGSSMPEEGLSGVARRDSFQMEGQAAGKPVKHKKQKKKRKKSLGNIEDKHKKRAKKKHKKDE